MSEITRYDPIEGVLAQLRERYEGVVFDVHTKDGMAAAKEAKRSLTKLRTGLEGLRKDEKAEHLERGRKIDGEAKRIETEIRSLEDPVVAQIEAEERRLEELRQAQAKRDAVAKQRLQEIEREPSFYAPGMSSRRMQERSSCFTAPLETDFAGSCISHKTAMEAFRQAERTISLIINEAIEAEAAAEQRRKEQEEFEAQRKALAEQQAELDRQKAEMERERRAQEEREAERQKPPPECDEATIPLADAQGFDDQPGGFDEPDLKPYPQTVALDQRRSAERRAAFAFGADPDATRARQKATSEVLNIEANRRNLKAWGGEGFDDEDPFGNKPKDATTAVAHAEQRTRALADAGVMQDALREIHGLTKSVNNALARRIAQIASDALGGI